MTTSHPKHGCILAVTGLAAEARIAAAPGVMTVSGGGDAARLALLLQASLAAGARAVISFGIAGGLAPGLKAGTVVVAEMIDDGETLWRTHAGWRARLLAALPQARLGKILGCDKAIEGAEGKDAAHWRTGAHLVDMESHVAARLATQYDVPFAALRIVSDPAERSLPRAALVGMRPDGTADVGAVLRALAAKPAELPALIRTAFDARAAFASLASARKQLDDLLGFATIAGEIRTMAGKGLGSAVALAEGDLS